MPYEDYTFAQDKRQYYPSGQPVQPQQAVTAGQVAGETPQQFAAGKAAANSATGEPLNLFKPVQTAPAVTTPVQTQGKSLVSHGGFAGTGKGVPQTKPITSMEDLAEAMGYTSPQEEERLRKASVANQRILAVGDALRQIGNIYNTTRYAPSQQFNSPVELERQRYLQGKALRDKANQVYLTYQQAKAKQDAAQRQWEATFNYNAAKDAATAQALKDYRDAKMNADRDKWKEQLAFNKDKWKEQSDLNERKFQQQTKHQNTMAGIASRNASTNAARLAWQKNRGGGRTGSPYVLPTKNGYINLGRDLNSNQIGKKALFSEMKNAGIIDSVWETQYNNMYDPQEQSALLNTAISKWLMNDDNAENYMKTHFGANPVSGVIDLGLTDDEDEDEMDLGLE